jgi:hypothetical protein
VSLSTLEAELVALKEATKESLYLRNLTEDVLLLQTIEHVKELQDTLNGVRTDRKPIPVEIRCDNARLVDSIKSGSIIGARSVRHLRLNAAWLTEQLKCNNVKFEFVAGAQNPADIFTKPMPPMDLERHLKSISVYYMREVCTA